ncbi:unnamed protein product [Rotaria socialis]|uniref:Uncharacterized protein n=1 Tax=Rotaria socialis TaxID=392032 RepID=A0A820XJ89_9BILA|nr:unnamed protein product [Rotaria socialis]
MKNKKRIIGETIDIHYYGPSLNDKCNIGDFVGLRIDKVDRTNTNPKLLPCVIIAKEEEKEKLACVHRVINQWWTFTSLVGLFTVPHELTHLKLEDLQEIPMITASKLYVRGAVNGICCSCKGGCKTKQCACKRNQVFLFNKPRSSNPTVGTYRNTSDPTGIQ